jgi:hypothetical protein
MGRGSRLGIRSADEAAGAGRRHVLQGRFDRRHRRSDVRQSFLSSKRIISRIHSMNGHTFNGHDGSNIFMSMDLNRSSFP